MLPGEFLRQQRERRKLTRAQLSELTGVKPASIVRYEKAGADDGQFPPYEKLAILSRVLGFDPRDFLHFTVSNEVERQQFDDHCSVLDSSLKRIALLTPEEIEEAKKKADEERKQEILSVPDENRLKFLKISQDIQELELNHIEAIENLDRGFMAAMTVLLNLRDALRSPSE